MKALDFELYGFQRRWLRDKSRFKIGMQARQTGKTFTQALDIADEMSEALVESRPCPWVLLSRGERQSKIAMGHLARHLKRYGAAFEELEADVDFGGAVYKQLEVRLNDDVWAVGLPANPDTARGYSSNVYLDEFAVHQNSRDIWSALFPAISAGWKIRVHSTPKGKGNKFYELMTGKDDDWSRHVVDIYQAVRDGCPRDIEELRRNLKDEDAWAQEYELKWLDEAAAWLSYDLICAVEDDKAGRPELYEGGPCYIGNDIAVRGDLWTAWVWEEVGDVLWTREVRALKRRKFAEQDAVMDELFERYNVARLAMDQTGMGEKPVEDAERRYGEYKVEGVLFTAGNKLILATAGKQAFEDRTVRIPEGNPVLRADLHKLQKVVGPTGQPRFVAESDTTGHADYAWAAFLGINAADRSLQPPAGASIESDETAYLPAAMAGRPSTALFGRRAEARPRVALAGRRRP